MFKFTIRELLLLTVIVAMGVGWWIDRSRKPEVYYVHLFATHYHVDMTKRDPMHPEYGVPVPLMTVSIQSAAPFHVAIPHNYLPTIEMGGVLSMSGKRCVGELEVFLTAPDLAMLDESITPLTIDKAHALQDPRFHLVISRSANPNDCDVPRGR
jgi:hypothetical protein